MIAAATVNHRTPRAFRQLVARWQVAVLAAHMPDSVKVFVICLSLHFNQERWIETGLLDAGGQDGPFRGLGLEAIGKETRLGERTLLRAIKRAEEEGFIRVKRARDPVTGHNLANIYYGHMPKKTGPCDTSVTRPGDSPCDSPHDTSVTLTSGKPLDNIPCSKRNTASADADDAPAPSELGIDGKKIDAMVKLGWLNRDGENISIPEYDPDELPF